MKFSGGKNGKTREALKIPDPGFCFITQHKLFSDLEILEASRSIREGECSGTTREYESARRRKARGDTRSVGEVHCTTDDDGRKRRHPPMNGESAGPGAAWRCVASLRGAARLERGGSAEKPRATLRHRPPKACKP